MKNLLAVHWHKLIKLIFALGKTNIQTLHKNELELIPFERKERLLPIMQSYWNLKICILHIDGCEATQHVEGQHLQKFVQPS